jgi:BirA family biotin operon repressor/biotin-[acetyl-CoA-carboxylase] ligase
LLELYRKQGFYRYKDSTASFEAEIAGVEPDGHLLLKRRDGSLCRYAFKEVAFDY